MVVVRHAGGLFLGKMVDAIITFFLFGALTAMAAGAGAIFTEQFSLPKLLGSGLIVAASLCTVLAGLYGVVLSISFVVPVLLLSVVGLSFAALATMPPDLKTISLWAQETNPAIPFWPAAALAYVSYNLVLAIPILAPSGAAVPDTRTASQSALLGGLGLGLGALAINMAILTVPFAATHFEIPIVYIAGSLSPWSKGFTGSCFLPKSILPPSRTYTASLPG